MEKICFDPIIVNTCLVFVGYLILRIQSIGIFNPNGISSMEESLSFNTIISFMTNTNFNIIQVNLVYLIYRRCLLLL